MNLRMTIPVLLAALLAGCDSSSTTTGTSSETVTGVRLYLPSGAPASGARAELFAVSDTGNIPVSQVYVDAQGRLALDAPEKGRYNLVIRHPDGTSLLQDSLLSDGSRISAWSDTLRPAGSVQGRVKVQPKDSPRIAWVHLLGSGVYANVDDSGRFDLGGVAMGRYTVAFLTQDAAYAPTFRSARVWPDSALDLGTVDLVYTGLPLVGGLRALHDTAAGILTLSWDRSKDKRVFGYVVYSGDAASSSLQEVKRTVDTSCSLQIFSTEGKSDWLINTDSTILHRNYRVVAVDSAGQAGPGWGVLELALPSPFVGAGAQVDWARIGPGPDASYLMKLDTLEGRLLAFGWSVVGGIPAYGDLALWESADGMSWVQTESGLKTPGRFENTFPMVWNGKLYRMEYHLRDSIRYNSGDWSKVARYDSVRVLVRTEPGVWQLAWNVSLPDSVNQVELVRLGAGLHLVALRYKDNVGRYLLELRGEFRLIAGGQSSASSEFSTVWPMDGLTGQQGAGFDLGTSGVWMRASAYAGDWAWVTKGVASWNGIMPSLPGACGSASFADDGKRVYLMGPGCSMTSPVGDTLHWGYLPIPTGNSVHGIWKGKLVSVGDWGTYIGTVVPR